MKSRLLLACGALVALSVATFAAEKPLLLQAPSLSKTEIAFAYGGSLWVVPREGGQARSLVTVDPGWAAAPIFSPDGQWVAFTANLDGNQDVYVVPAAGGPIKRLTTHPDTDVAVGWTPDGKRVLVRSAREAYSRFERLLTVPLEGGLPEALPLPMGVQGAFSPDGAHVAYVPRWNRRGGAGDAYIAIKQYEGGKTSPIWIAQLSDSSITPVPRKNSNDFNPMWVGDQVYFLSDREGATTLFSYDVKSQTVKKLVANDGFDLKSAAAGPGAIVYEQFGSLHLYDLASGKSRAVAVQITGEFPQTRARFEKIPAAQVRAGDLSPSGARAVFQMRGEIVSVPAEKGDARNLTRSPGVADRSPAWSPDGKWIAYLSDESGEYALHLRDQTGRGEVRKIALGAPSFFYDPVWSPDSKKIALRDKRLNLWYLDVTAEKPALVKVDTDRFDAPPHRFDPAWSPDSRWIAYTKQLENYQHAVYVYSLETAQVTQLTDGMSDALNPVFDRGGKYLYFTASTDVGLTSGWLDLSSAAHPTTSTVYLAVLAKDQPSPFAPESDEEKPDDAEKKSADKPAEKSSEEPVAVETAKPVATDVAAAKAANEKPKSSDDKKADKAKDKEPPKVAIDFDGISQRIVSLPMPARNYLDLVAGKEGVLYVLEGPDVSTGDEERDAASVQRFDLKTRKTEKLLDGVDFFVLAAKGEKMLWNANKKWFIAAADKAPKPGEGALKTDALEVWVEPRAEWRQIYREVWRIQRDFFYDPNFHGLDLAQAEKVYAPFLDGIVSRADLNYLFAEMLGQLNVQHLYVAGGAKPELKNMPVGLLGADYRLAEGRYQFARVFNGENWNPSLQAPLTQPGVNVKAGDFLLAVNGRELRGTDEVFAFFAGTVGKQTVLRVGPSADGKDARDVTVVPIASEGGLRNRAWIEGNRRKVDELSGGKLAYVYLPDTANGGYTSFNRYYFAQVGREGAVLDERFNGGGQLADYIVDYSRRRLLSLNLTREGEIARSPAAAIYGPKVMLMNEFAGSGGDAMPWYFRKLNVGPLVGTRTWGGLVGIGDYPALIDGGSVTAPRWAIFGTKGEWEVENVGIAPDVEVELDPKLVRQGRDPQLEKAVEVALDLLQKSPPAATPVPPFPKYQPRWPKQN